MSARFTLSHLSLALLAATATSLQAAPDAAAPAEQAVLLQETQVLGTAEEELKQAPGVSIITAEDIRSGIRSIPKAQYEAARSIGFGYLGAMGYVVLPQALRNIIPQIGNNFIINIKDTSVLSVISITDLFFVHKSVVGALYTYFESAAIVMVIYLTMTLFASYLLRLWEKALDGPQNYDLNTTDSLAYTSGMYNAPDPNHESQNLDMKGGAAHV